MLFWRRKHPISDEELGAYVDGQLEAAARARLEAHVEGCAACGQAVAELRALRRALRALPRAAAPRSFALRGADVRPPEAPRPSAALGRAPALLGGLATAAFLALGVLVGIDVGVRPSEDEAAEVTGLPAPSGEEVSEGVAREEAYEPGPATPAAGALAASADADEEMEAEAGLPDEPGVDQQVPKELQATPRCPPNARCPEAFYETSDASPTPAGAARAEEEVDDDGRTRLRVAEAATAAVALVAGVSLALVWWRRRA